MRAGEKNLKIRGFLANEAGEKVSADGVYTVGTFTVSGPSGVQVLQNTSSLLEIDAKIAGKYEVKLEGSGVDAGYENTIIYYVLPNEPATVKVTQIGSGKATDYFGVRFTPVDAY